MKYTLTAERLRIWLAIALLAMLALGSFWALEVMRRNDEENNAKTSLRNEPDYYVEKFNFVRLPNNGKANYTISGERLTHLPKTDNFEIRQPRINSFDADKPPLNIRADRAIVEQKSSLAVPAREHDQIHLQGQVQVVRPDSAASGYFELQSEYLLLLPDDNIIKTDQAITMLTNSSEIHAVGMIANNETQQIQMLSKVRASFGPIKSKSKL
jgi:lipopolysaccharide export system protein LptC